MATDHSTPILEPRQLRRRFLDSLESRAEAILAASHPDGRFGTEPWIVRDQDGILPLALLYASEGSAYRGDSELLETIGRCGCYLREQQDEKGMYSFDKKDGSNWGKIYMPWTYLRWIISYDLLVDALSDELRQTWEAGLKLGYQGISDTELSSASNIYPGPLPGQKPPAEGEVIPWIHNIPCHHAAGLYLAGGRFNRPEWKEQAGEFMHRVVEAQSEHGWWTEHQGPVVMYNRVYLESLAIFYHYSGDAEVGQALERGNTYHLHYTYPNGSNIETVDERNPYPPVDVEQHDEDGAVHYLPRLGLPHPGHYASPDGRALLEILLKARLERQSVEVDNAEYLLLCLPETLGEASWGPQSRFAMGNDALVVREDPWVLSYSAYCSDRTPNRFIQDRQNLFSVFHRDSGLILGGGNTKMQPLWSTMTVGDPSLLSPEGSTRETPLAPEIDLDYVPDRASIRETDKNAWQLRVETAGAILDFDTVIQSEDTLRIQVTQAREAPDGRPVNAHLTFIRYPETSVTLSDGSVMELEEQPWTRSGIGKLQYRQWELALPETAVITWPALPHNPYTGDGHAEIKEGRLVVSLPFSDRTPSYELTLQCRVDELSLGRALNFNRRVS